MPEIVNEITFVARLGVATRLRAERRRGQGLPVLIENGEIEERQVDRQGGVRRCDIRLNTRGGAKLVSGEMKRPEVPEGRDPRNGSLIADARRKAVARGLQYYFTCNMREVVLFSVAPQPGSADREETSFVLGPVRTSADTEALREEIEGNWIAFLDDLEDRLIALGQARPSVTTDDVILLRDAINAIAEEGLGRASRLLVDDTTRLDQVRDEAAAVLGFDPALNPADAVLFREELLQLLRFGIFVTAQKLILYRVLAETGPRRSTPYRLDHLVVNAATTDPRMVQNQLDTAIAQAIDRSGDYETAFLPRPLEDLVFCTPVGMSEVQECQVGHVWARLLEAVENASWDSISQNLVGFLYEVIVDERFRHQLGQFYTREDVVDVLVAFAVREPADTVLDPASGGGSFLRAAYSRKKSLGSTHEQSLAEVWGCEITAFAAELGTITLATSDPFEAAAYPRVFLTDFFEVRPGYDTGLILPDTAEAIAFPSYFDGIVGNPPYISYRRQTNQSNVLNALARMPEDIALPRFSGKSDAYVWFIVHATRFLRPGGRLSFVVSSAILFADYGVPLIQFIAKHFRIVAVVDSLVERWFPDADTNTVLIMLEREDDEQARQNNSMRFVRLRRALSQLLAAPGDHERRQSVEDLLELIVTSPQGGEDPRLAVNVIAQGDAGGLTFGAGDEDEDESEQS